MRRVSRKFRLGATPDSELRANGQLINLLSHMLPVRRWLRFSLGTLLIFITVCGVVLGLIQQRAMKRSQAMIDIRHAGGQVIFDLEAKETASRKTLAWLYGPDTFAKVLTVWVHGSGVGDDLVCRLTAFPELRRVSLVNTRVTDIGISHLSALKNLEWAMLNQTSIGDESISHLSQLERLKILNVAGTKITDDSIDHFARLSNLTLLDVSNTALTDKSYQALAKIKSLECLKVQGTRMRSDGLHYLDQHPNLKRIDLTRKTEMHTYIGNVDDYPNIRWGFGFRKVAAPDSALDAFKVRNPGCKITSQIYPFNPPEQPRKWIVGQRN